MALPKFIAGLRSRGFLQIQRVNLNVATVATLKTQNVSILGKWLSFKTAVTLKGQLVQWKMPTGPNSLLLKIPNKRLYFKLIQIPGRTFY